MMIPKKTILFIEDDLMIGELYKIALDDKGFDVDFQTTAAEGLLRLRDSSRHYDLILLDLSMLPAEEMDKDTIVFGLASGVYIAKESLKLRPTLPIVVLTNVYDKMILNLLPLDNDSNTIQICHKMDFSPYELSDMISKHLLLNCN